MNDLYQCSGSSGDAGHMITSSHPPNIPVELYVTFCGFPTSVTRMHMKVEEIVQVEFQNESLLRQPSSGT